MLSIEELRRRLPEAEKHKILEYGYPKPYPDNPSNIRAILLGCDPSNKHYQDLPYVFAIKSSHKVFNSFVKSIERQLKAVGLSLETVYSQNLCRNYFENETSKNRIWEKVAKLWIPVLKEELDIKFKETIPVLLTAEILYLVLLKKDVPKRKAKQFYDCEDGAAVPVPADENHLVRPLVPFYRHPAYDLSSGNWGKYITEIQKIME